MLRRILSWPSAPAVVVLNNICYNTGYTDQDCHNELGGWYGLPHVSVRDTIYQRMLSGEFTQGQLTADGLHPNDTGHGLIAGKITALLERVKAEPDIPEAEPPLPPPMTGNSYEHARQLTIREISPVLSGFRADADHPVFLDGNFGEDWGDCLYLEPVLHRGRRGRHTVELTVAEAPPGVLTPFYLLSLIVA